MGLIEKTIQKFECDRCNTIISEYEVQPNYSLKIDRLWSEYINHNNAISSEKEGLDVVLKYSKGHCLCDGILCDKCKVTMLGILIDKIKDRITESESKQKGRKKK